VERNKRHTENTENRAVTSPVGSGEEKHSRSVRSKRRSYQEVFRASIHKET